MQYPCIDALGFSRRATACQPLPLGWRASTSTDSREAFQIAVKSAATRRASTCDGRTQIFFSTLLGPLGSLSFTAPRAFPGLH